ncbi:MAG: hypothetical protein ACLU38_01550 [Dysosmobacter sp.]
MNAVFATGSNEVQRTLRRRMAITYNNLYLDIRQQLQRAAASSRPRWRPGSWSCFGANKSREELTRDGRLYASAGAGAPGAGAGSRAIWRESRWRTSSASGSSTACLWTSPGTC